MSDMNALADRIDPRTAEPGTNILTRDQLAELHAAGICLAQRSEIIAASDALRAMGWRPIGEAPKDKTPVLIGWIDSKGVYIARWDNSPSWGVSRDAKCWTDGHVHFREPSQWQPLPAAPEAKP